MLTKCNDFHPDYAWLLFSVAAFFMRHPIMPKQPSGLSRITSKLASVPFFCAGQEADLRSSYSYYAHPVVGISQTIAYKELFAGAALLCHNPPFRNDAVKCPSSVMIYMLPFVCFDG